MAKLTLTRNISVVCCNKCKLRVDAEARCHDRCCMARNKAGGIDRLNATQLLHPACDIWSVHSPWNLFESNTNLHSLQDRSRNPSGNPGLHWRQATIDIYSQVRQFSRCYVSCLLILSLRFFDGEVRPSKCFISMIYGSTSMCDMRTLLSILIDCSWVSTSV